VCDNFGELGFYNSRSSLWFVVLTMTIAESDFPIDNGMSCVPISPEEEKRIVKDLIKQSELNLKDGNLYFIISNRF